MMKPFLVGLDPGPTRSAVVMLKRLPGEGRAQYLHGDLVSGGPALVDWLRRFAPADVTLVAREKVMGYAYAPCRSAQLLATQDRGAHFAGAVQALGYEVCELSAEAWRKQLTGRSNAGDALIKHALPRFVDGLPARTNAHIRDAVGVALVAAWCGPKLAKALESNHKPKRPRVGSDGLLTALIAVGGGKSR